VGEGTEEGKLESYKGSGGQAGRRIRMASSGGCAREKINEAVSQLAREIKKGEKRGIIYRRSPPHSDPIYGERPTVSSSFSFPVGAGVGWDWATWERRGWRRRLGDRVLHLFPCTASPGDAAAVPARTGWFPSSASLPATTLWLCRADQPRPLEPAGWVGPGSLQQLTLAFFCYQIFRFLKKMFRSHLLLTRDSKFQIYHIERESYMQEILNLDGIKN